MNHKLKYKDRVQIHSTSSKLLDNKFGNLIGVAAEFAEGVMWIVSLDNPLDGCSAVVLPESYLKYVENKVDL